LLVQLLVIYSSRDVVLERGSEKALTKLTKYVFIILDNHNKTIGIFLDLIKVFDNIPHTKLLNCIMLFGIIGSAYSIFKSYLEDRTQQVKIGTIHRGDPQGTVLSPILYIYISHMLHICYICFILRSSRIKRN
jgi:hypothetical protein